MRVLYIGGTGEISASCVQASIALGHEVTVLNRGNHRGSLPPEATHVAGDLQDPHPYQAIQGQHFDVVCQFLAYTPEIIERDVRYFSGNCGQYIFISTASAYHKKQDGMRIRESRALNNPHWAYSRSKAACEDLLNDASITSTIVRPSHTYINRLPSTVVDGNHLAWRMSRGKPILVHDGGQSLWTLTHAEDFAAAFVQLHGNDAALDDVFHITSDEAHSWNDILSHVANAVSYNVELVGIDSDDLISYIPELEGPLLGDKAHTMIFDNSKIRSVTNEWACSVTLADGISRAAQAARENILNGYRPDEKLDALLDQILMNRMT